MSKHVHSWVIEDNEVQSQDNKQRPYRDICPHGYGLASCAGI